MNSSKKATLSFSVCLMGLMAPILQVPAQTDVVYSVNVVGFQKVTVPPADVGGGLQLLGVPFDANPGTLDEVVGTHGIYGSTVGTADNIIMYDPTAGPSAQYKTYYLRFNASAEKPMWRYAGETQVWATNVYLYPNQGFWYRNRATVAFTNVMTGDVVYDATVSVTVRPGLQLLSYPYSSEIVMTDLGLTNGTYGSTVGTADTIIMYDPEAAPGQQYLTYYLRFNALEGKPMWRYAGSTQVWATNTVIKPQQGFWYKSIGAGNFEWLENRPYNIE
jgi:hypothetical protein